MLESQKNRDTACFSVTTAEAAVVTAAAMLPANRQGHESSIQYRTGICYTDEKHLPEIRKVYRAQEETYHQKYPEKNLGNTATSRRAFSTPGNEYRPDFAGMNHQKP